MRDEKKNKQRKKEGKDDLADLAMAELLEEVEEENAAMRQVEEKISRHRRQFYKRILLGIAFVAVVSVIALLILNLQTYQNFSVLSEYSVENAASSTFQEFGDGLLKYNRNGVSFLNHSGEEKWSYPIQFQTIGYTNCEDTAVLYSQSGNSLLIVGTDGVKGEISTVLPIQKAVVSSQGVVCVLMEQETTPQIVFYDVEGNVLVEHKASVSQVGYPVDIAISPNGYLLAVSYLYLEDGSITGKVAYYNFDTAGQEEENYKVTEEEISDEIIGKLFFLDNQTSVAVGENELIFYAGSQTPQKQKVISFEGEVEHVFQEDGYIGVLLDKTDGSKEIRLYTRAGKEKFSKEITGEYDDVTMTGKQIILLSSNHCLIYSLHGRRIFDGELGGEVERIIPLLGVNKYLIVGSNGIQTIRLIK